MRLDSIDKKLIDLLQAKFPLTRKPYAELGQSLGIAEDKVIQRIGQFKADGLVRLIGPVFDAARLGYRSTLVAMRVVATPLDEATQLIIEHPRISHAYERDHHFNLWFTLAVPAAIDMEAELQWLTNEVKAETAFTLLALRLFKLRTYFSSNGDEPPETTIANGVKLREAALSSADRRIINELQQDLPLLPCPFVDMSAQSGMDEAEFLARCQSLLSHGIMRRFGAAINHRKVGFAFNAMTCWVVPPQSVVAVGQKLARLREVSHCYERKTNPLWRYNLFAMIHSHSKEACQEIVAKASAEIGLNDYVMLFSTREFKKTRVKYLV